MSQPSESINETRKRLPLDESSNQVAESLQKHFDEVAGALVCQPSVGVELLVGARDEHFRLQQRVRVGENERLSKLSLASRGPGHAGRRAHDRRDLAIQDTFARWPRQPINGVLQDAGYAMVVLRRHDQQRVGLPHRRAQVGDAARSACRLDIAVVEWDRTKIVNNDVKGGCGEFSRRPQERSVVRGAPKTAGETNDLERTIDARRISAHDRSWPRRRRASPRKGYDNARLPRSTAGIPTCDANACLFGGWVASETAMMATRKQR